MNESDYKEALNEIAAEIEWRSKMHNKAEDEKKRRYWHGRVEKAKKVKRVLEEMRREILKK